METRYVGVEFADAGLERGYVLALWGCVHPAEPIRDTRPVAEIGPAGESMNGLDLKDIWH